MIQLQGDQRKDVQEFLVDKKEGLELDAKTIKVCRVYRPAAKKLGVANDGTRFTASSLARARRRVRLLAIVRMRESD